MNDVSYSGHASSYPFLLVITFVICTIHASSALGHCTTIFGSTFLAFRLEIAQHQFNLSSPLFHRRSTVIKRVADPVDKSEPTINLLSDGVIISPAPHSWTCIARVPTRSPGNCFSKFPRRTAGSLFAATTIRSTGAHVNHYNTSTPSLNP